MAFFWIGNQLSVKHGEYGSTDDKDPWTTFLMDMREPIEVNISSLFFKNISLSSYLFNTFGQHF